MRTLSQASPSMRSLPPRPSMRSLPSPPMMMLPPVNRGAPPMSPESPSTAPAGELVVARDAAASVSSPRRTSLWLPPGQALDVVEAVADVVEVRRQQAGEAHVGVRRLRVAAVGDPVEADHALVALDPGAGDHDVVAALGVVVVVTAVADDDVVSPVRPLLERVAVVALEEVGLRAALDPVVPLVGEHVSAESPAMTKSSPPPANVSFGFAPATDESPAGAGEDEVEAAARVDRVVALAALDVVVAEQVGEDVVALARGDAGARERPRASARATRQARSA